MLVIISDLHLTDGTSGEIINDRAFRLFRNRVSDMAYDASWRSQESTNKNTESKDGEEIYKPIDEVNIILLGDILDMIRSEKWNDALEDIMPWTKEKQDQFYAQIELIASDILKFNASSFNILKGMADGDITIPEKMVAVNPEEIPEKRRYDAVGKKAMKVNIYYMVGNHDWFFYIQDPRIDSIRNRVIDELGLSNEKGKPFPYLPSEVEALQKLQDEHKVYAIHGDEFDKTNYREPHRDSSSVGDVVVIKLLNQVPKKIEENIRSCGGVVGSEEDINSFIRQLREVDNLRPYALAPAWITQVLKDTNLDNDQLNNCIKDALKSLIDDFVENDLVSHNLKLKIGMKAFELMIAGHFSIETLSNVVDLFGLSKDQFESYRKHAIEKAKDMEKDFFVMGHTHYAEVVPLCTYIDSAGIKRNKIYMNTGTWRALHITGEEDKSFISYKTMTIAGFFKPDERKGRPFEFWTGSLAL